MFHFIVVLSKIINRQPSSVAHRRMGLAACWARGLSGREWDGGMGDSNQAGPDFPIGFLRPARVGALPRVSVFCILARVLRLYCQCLLFPCVACIVLQNCSTPLHFAVLEGHSEVVERLIAARAIVNAADKVAPRTRHTALYPMAASPHEPKPRGV